ncbi:DNA repair protein RecN [hydrothermal vent metagenome]|uniref:DNA repair protein RecN n=1 Tax=hydrothermal vent metagenome TaxID=652676 RepID=A0A3B0ZN10_9ZZZZ
MLTNILIRNYTIVDQLELDLNLGMTAMTGETGAGKSILVDALGLALGDRADSGIIRAGSDTAEINISFDLTDCPAALEWLIERDMNSAEECFIRRTIPREGRSKGFINSHPCSMTALKELGEMLVDIHGQHQHQSLVKKDIQRQLLDDFAANQPLLNTLNKTFTQWQKTSQEFERLRTASADSAARSELLRFQVDELDKLALTDNEPDELSKEHDKLANAGMLLDTCQLSVSMLFENEEDSIHHLLNQVHQKLNPVCDIDRDLQNANNLVNDAIIQTQEAADELRSYLDRLDLDPQRLDWVNDRLEAVHDLSRKHHVRPEELPTLATQLADELDSLDNSDDHLEKLQLKINALEQDYHQTAAKLTRKRHSSATKLNHEVTKIIQDLGMPNAVFEIAVSPFDPVKLTRYGVESVEYKVRTNPGSDMKLLSKVASGGELSRVSLAIQVVLAQTTRINTLVYDEVDTGIGGPTAEIVGQLLRTLGKDRQVMCVTHLPQVAAQAHNHLQVRKKSDEENTVTGINTLSDNARIEEIARMLGGVKLTEQSRAHAAEMLKL